MWKGTLSFGPPMLWSVGFMVTFLLGGLTGVILASPPLDFHVHDTYFVVAHFHYVLLGTIVFATFAGIYFWFPKMTGRMLDERLGKWQFWLTFIGFHLTFLVQHWLGFYELPRIRSERPAFELHYPAMTERIEAEKHVARREKHRGCGCRSRMGKLDGLLAEYSHAGRACHCSRARRSSPIGSSLVVPQGLHEFARRQVGSRRPGR